MLIVILKAGPWYLNLMRLVHQASALENPFYILLVRHERHLTLQIFNFIPIKYWTLDK